MDRLLQVLNAIYPMSHELIEYLAAHIKHRILSRRQFLLRAGHVSRDICFIESGLMRCYYLKDDTEISSWFMKEDDVIVSVESFFQQKISYESIQALETTNLYCISYEELQLLYKTFPEFNFIGRVLTERYYTQSEQRLYSIRMQKSRNRYKHLMDTHPELIMRVPSKYLASYLGVREETLSRLRGRKYL
ncbi:MAG: Crp/Fnr family transcriptional regulator [Chitinophagaceae bacterium]|nr:Crp/Fnr family transcriptional regulator [Chitinophagaceae bacterium]